MVGAAAPPPKGRAHDGVPDDTPRGMTFADACRARLPSVRRSKYSSFPIFSV